MKTAPYALRTGLALSLTVGVAYTACALAFWLWPEASAGFMSALFHGLDFGKLRAGQARFSFDGFGYALLVMMAWAFALGVLFGLIQGDLDLVDLGQASLDRQRQATRR